MCFRSLWGTKRAPELHHALLLHLSSDPGAPLQCKSLLSILLLHLLFLLLPLIQRAKRRVCWKSFSGTKSRQERQVGIRAPFTGEKLQSVTAEDVFVPLCPAADVEAPAPPEAAAEGGASSVSVSAPKVSIPSSAHHYCFSLDLCSLGKLSLPHPIAATLR